MELDNKEKYLFSLLNLKQWNLVNTNTKGKCQCPYYPGVRIKLASYADILLARHTLLPNERLLKRASISFPCPQRSAGDHVHN